jgi:DNA invertase Pin-like site-specific DNA recombinase
LTAGVEGGILIVSKETNVRFNINEVNKMVYGYARISTGKQNIDRQIRNIKAAYPDAVIVKEIYTGTEYQGRKELQKIIKHVSAGDSIVFDSVSRMSRNAEEGFNLYQQLFNKNIDLVFLKEPQINTQTYRSAISTQVKMTGTDADLILEGVNKYLMKLAQKQIEIAFDQAQKEVQDLHQRTAEGIQTARLNGSQIGQIKGAKLKIKKAAPAKATIRKYSKNFSGTLSDAAVMKIAGISRNTYYKYKKAMKGEITK